MSSKENYLISELADKAGVSVRTIRYYIEKGLLPSPHNRGRYSIYDEDYLYRIKLIKLFQEEGRLTLDEIKDEMDTLSAEQVRLLVEKMGDQVRKPSALYQEAVMADSATEYIERVLSLRGRGSKVIQESAPLIQSQSIKQKEQQPTSQTSTTQSWQRVEFVKGVELHIQEGLPSDVMRRVERLIRKGRELFGN